ncbi:MAG: hypothetical protein ACYCTB_10760 [bacterium]
MIKTKKGKYEAYLLFITTVNIVNLFMLYYAVKPVAGKIKI